MARIKISDLPKDMKINSTELRRIFGGGSLTAPPPGASPKDVQKLKVLSDSNDAGGWFVTLNTPIDIGGSDY